jgi:hypothetical protein
MALRRMADQSRAAFTARMQPSRKALLTHPAPARSHHVHPSLLRRTHGLLFNASSIPSNDAVNFPNDERGASAATRSIISCAVRLAASFYLRRSLRTAACSGVAIAKVIIETYGRHAVTAKTDAMRRPRSGAPALANGSQKPATGQENWRDPESGEDPVDIWQPPSLDATPHGVLAARGPSPPDPIGLSIAKLANINGCELSVDQPDLLDKTPILDIEPYVPGFDCRLDVRGRWFELFEGQVSGMLPDDRFGGGAQK